MVDGVSVLAQMMWTMKSTGVLRDERESFLFDGGAPFYRWYQTADGKYMAAGAIEPQFFAELLAGLGLSANEVPNQFDFGSYPQMGDVFTARFASRTRGEWAEIFVGTDACVTPVLTWSEAANDAHLTERATVINTTVSSRPRLPRGSRARLLDRSAHHRPQPHHWTNSAGNRAFAGKECPPAGLRC